MTIINNTVKTYWFKFEEVAQTSQNQMHVTGCTSFFQSKRSQQVTSSNTPCVLGYLFFF